ncbi:MAG: lytic murein transglycosylase B [Pseudomonadota bacterium]
MRIVSGALATLAVLLSTAAWAQQNYASHPEVTALIEEMATEYDFNRAYLHMLFTNAERKDSILEAIARPAEKTKAWHEYRRIFVTEDRTQQGVDFVRRYGDSLLRAEREYGVPMEMIAAIIGVETRYGRHTGSYRVIDALSTLAFDYPPRAEFFGGELRAYLLMTREQNLPADALKGSYAGAMGFGQFIPSSYRAYAVDFDQDGVVDIINNPVDAIGSVANYFKQHQWRAGLPVAARGRVDQGYRAEWANEGLKPRRSLAELAGGGIYAEQPLAPETLATVMAFEGESGPEYWLGWHNFYVITRYNHSAMYAMSVYQLSQAIGARL